ncbi:hypothetical protein Y032_0131g1665 [Ancylostoma ceylanicum]|uniref:Uncharacterized protein n=1 Tax=Ancylostoma ceylanicum TaxID=53326 RepID=A0A016T6B4_9BILA|nr:hypothetical protein Y032_0131g1665 [Ancylostoma ceylanicum]
MWDAPPIRLHPSIVEALNAYVPHKVTWASDEPIQCFFLPDLSGTNLPTSKGWMAWLPTGAFHRPCACAASLLPLRYTRPEVNGMNNNT